MVEREPIVQVHRVKKPGQRKKLINALIALIVFIILACSAFFFLYPKKNKIVLNDFTTATVSLQELENSLSLTGLIDISSKKSILSPYDAVCTSILKKSADFVEKGEVILTLDSPTLINDRDKLLTDLKKLKRENLKREIIYKRNIRSTESRIKKANRQLERAQESLKQIQSLYDLESATLVELKDAQDLVEDTKDESDDAKTSLINLKEDFKAENELIKFDTDSYNDELEIKNSTIGNLDIKSPITGTVLTLGVEVGDQISQHTSIVNVGDLKTPYIKMQVPEKNRKHISVGQKVNIKVGNKYYSGVLTQINAMAVQGAKGGAAIAVEAAFDNPPEGIVPGAKCGIEIIINKTKDALTLPRGAFIISGKERYLYIVDGKEAKRVKVEFGAMNSSHIAITKGVNIGDEIIISSYSDYISEEKIYLDQKY